ncbi:hypothetical protein BC834DRAFT_965295 [Gloeopeniophorella convolvens]|nr:hypothetical protein BC834DRAFT_965295 [Gloeopeniophorella convolvens]
MSNSPNRLDSEQIQRLLDQGVSQQQVLAMLQQQQNGRGGAGSQAFPGGFNPVPASPNPGASTTDIPAAFLNNSNMNAAAAKQFAALSAVGLARRAQTSRPSTLGGGPTSASFLGGMSSVGQQQQQSPSPAPGHDPLSSLSASQSRLSAQTQSLAHHSPSAQPAPFAPSPSDPFMAAPAQLAARAPQQQQQLNPQYKAKQRQFLTTLANFHLARKDPLPPALTGIAYPPGFDPSQSKWKSLEPSLAEPGSFMLAGKPVDLFRLWLTAASSGGFARLSQERLWPSVLQVFDLPETFVVNGNAHPVAQILSNYYKVILLPFEEFTRKNSQQRPMLGAQGQPGQPQQPGQHGVPSQLSGGDLGAQGMIPSAMPHMDGNPALSSHPSFASPQIHRQSSAGLNMLPTGSSLQSPDVLAGVGSSISQPFLAQASPDGSQLGLQNQTQDAALPFDAELESRKRKTASEMEAKRVRQRTTDPPEAVSSTADRSSAPPAGDTQPKPAPGAEQQPDTPQRRKVEYVPLLREIDTAGGRDLRAITEEQRRLASLRTLRGLDEWGNIDIDSLTMSLRSRISTELGYGLTTFTLLSIMRGQGTSGFPIANCPDLMDEALDLLLEITFGGKDGPDASVEPSIVTYRELVDAILEDGSKPFATLERKQGLKDHDLLGPKQRPGDIVLAIINIMRNLSVVPDNVEFLANHERLLTCMLRVCEVHRKQDGTLRAASDALTLRDVVAIRRDVLYLLVNLSGPIRLAPSIAHASNPSPAALEVAQRGYALTASYLVDSAETTIPSELFLLTGMTANAKPPLLVDAALDVLCRFGQPDVNRQVIAKAVPTAWLRQLFEALMHRLPIVDADFQIAKREAWLSYIEKDIMALYAIAFLAPPSLKEELKKDQQLGFVKIMFRLVRKFTVGVPQEMRGYFAVCARRVVETLKLVDDGDDAFDTSQNTGGAVLSFGVGYGEVGEDQVEKGTGSLSGFQEEVVWGVMLQKDVDDSMFRELESLARVG